MYTYCISASGQPAVASARDGCSVAANDCQSSVITHCTTHKPHNRSNDQQPRNDLCKQIRAENEHAQQFPFCTHKVNLLPGNRTEPPPPLAVVMIRWLSPEHLRNPPEPNSVTVRRARTTRTIKTQPIRFASQRRHHQRSFATSTSVLRHVIKGEIVGIALRRVGVSVLLFRALMFCSLWFVRCTYRAVVEYTSGSITTCG